MSGYELHKRFAVSVGHVWHAPDSQIYPELRRMVDDGLLDGESQARGERATRRVYRVTEAGNAAFLAWMNGPLEYRRGREPAHLRAAYLESATREAARDFLGRHIAHWSREQQAWETELRSIDELTSPMLRERLAVIPEADREPAIAFKRFTYEGLLARASAEIAWAHRGLELLEQLARSGEPETGEAGSDAADTSA